MEEQDFTPDNYLDISETNKDERAPKWRTDRLKNGWCDLDTWSMDSWFAKCASEMLLVIASNQEITGVGEVKNQITKQHMVKQNEYVKEMRETAEKLRLYYTHHIYVERPTELLREAMLWLADNLPGCWW